MSLDIFDQRTRSLYQRTPRPGLEGQSSSTVEEQLAVRSSLLRKARDPDEEVRAYERLAEAIPLLVRWRILPMLHPAPVRYDSLKGIGLNVHKMDLHIASIILEIGAVSVSRKLRDFRRIPNLSAEDWVADGNSARRDGGAHRKGSRPLGHPRD
jgi:predicted nucleic acid-binding protein